MISAENIPFPRAGSAANESWHLPCFMNSLHRDDSLQSLPFTSMAKYKLEYIWLDGYTPLANLRSKTQIKEFASFPQLEELPNWGFDGSSTQQAEGKSSDIVLKPVAVYPDSTRKHGVLVMCECYQHTGVPSPSNSRATIPDDAGTWFGFEQEYFFYKDGAPLGFPKDGYPAPQGPYYTGVGYKAVGDIAREIVEEHLDLCLDAGINHEGINAEVAKGQWEFQIFGKGSRRAADEVWVARYLLVRLCEKYGIDVEFHCKPIKGDWNGSGMHANFSTTYLREKGGKAYFEALMAAFGEHCEEHIAVYGPDNHLRLTGLHETQSIDKFSYGVADRGASVRVPHSFVKDNAYHNPFWTETALFRTDRGNSMRVAIWWRGAQKGGERARYFGDKMSFYFSDPTGTNGPAIVRAETKAEKDSGGFERTSQVLEKYAEVKWWQTDMLPEPLRHDSGHEGSHCFITHEFVDAIAKGRKPFVGLDEALAYTVPGMIAHQSALNGGQSLKIPTITG